MYDLSGLEVPQDLEIVVTTPAYFERLGPLLQNTDPEYAHNLYNFIDFALLQLITMPIDWVTLI